MLRLQIAHHCKARFKRQSNFSCAESFTLDSAYEPAKGNAAKGRKTFESVHILSSYYNRLKYLVFEGY